MFYEYGPFVPPMQYGGPSDLVEHAASEHSQDVWGFIEGPSRRSETPPMISPAILVALLSWRRHV